MTRIAAILVLCLAGCASRQELPPMPGDMQNIQHSTFNIQPRTAARAAVLPQGTVELAWDAYTNVAGVVGFNVYSGTNSRSYTSKQFVPGVTTTNTTVPAEKGVFKYYAVTATNSAGLESAYSLEVGYRAPVQAFTVRSLYRTNLTAGAVFTNWTTWLYEPSEPARYYYHTIEAE